MKCVNCLFILKYWLLDSLIILNNNEKHVEYVLKIALSDECDNC